jgi:hypothetical protein
MVSLHPTSYPQGGVGLFVDNLNQHLLLVKSPPAYRQAGLPLLAKLILTHKWSR